MKDIKSGAVGIDEEFYGKSPTAAFEFTEPGNASPHVSIVSGWGFSFPRFILSKSDSYTLTERDNSCTVLVTTGASDRTITLYPITGATYVIQKADTGAGKVTVNPSAGTNIIVYSGGEAWSLSSFELIQVGDFVAFFYNGSDYVKINPPYWHKVANPGTGNLGSKTSGWTADSFSGGLEVTFSNDPIGTLAVNVPVVQASTQSEVYWRKSGDSNISNTPAASNDDSTFLMGSDDDVMQAVIWLSSDKKAQFAVTDTNTDLYIPHPSGYYQ